MEYNLDSCIICGSRVAKCDVNTARVAWSFETRRSKASQHGPAGHKIIDISRMTAAARHNSAQIALSLFLSEARAEKNMNIIFPSYIVRSLWIECSPVGSWIVFLYCRNAWSALTRPMTVSTAEIRVPTCELRVTKAAEALEGVRIEKSLMESSWEVSFWKLKIRP